MKTELIHPFIGKCHDLLGLLDGCNDLETYMSRVVDQSKFAPLRYSSGDINGDVYKGDALELLVEAVIKNMGNYPQIGISGYRPVLSHNDNGVDGIGKGMRGQVVTVQVKWRSDPRHLLTSSDGLDSFAHESWNEGVEKVKGEQNMLVVTTGWKLDQYTDNVKARNGMRCIGIGIPRSRRPTKDNPRGLRNLVNGNGGFWDDFTEMCIEYVEARRVVLGG